MRNGGRGGDPFESAQGGGGGRNLDSSNGGAGSNGAAIRGTNKTFKLMLQVVDKLQVQLQQG